MTAINNELVEVRNNQVVVSSRQVAEKFGKEHKHVLDNIREIIRAEFSALTYFQENTYKAGTGKSYPEYLMNRDGFTLLAMGFTGKEALHWKMKYIEAFNAMEEELKNIHYPQVPKTFYEALLLAAEQQKQLEEAKPKVEFVDNYVDKGINICLMDLGKKLGKRPRKFIELLQDEGYLMRHRNNMPYQQYINQGLFEVKTVTEKGLSQTVVTPKGVTYFAKKYADADV